MGIVCRQRVHFCVLDFCSLCMHLPHLEAATLDTKEPFCLDLIWQTTCKISKPQMPITFHPVDRLLPLHDREGFTPDYVGRKIKTSTNFLPVKKNLTTGKLVTLDRGGHNPRLICAAQPHSLVFSLLINFLSLSISLSFKELLISKCWCFSWVLGPEHCLTLPEIP